MSPFSTITKMIYKNELELLGADGADVADGAGVSVACVGMNGSASVAGGTDVNGEDV